MTDEQETDEAECLRRKLMFQRFWADAGVLIGTAQAVVIRSTGESKPADVLGSIVSALGRYVAMTSAIEGSGAEVFDKICEDGLKPMFVAMFDVQREQKEKQGAEAASN